MEKVFKEVNVIPNSEEWFLWRRTRLGGTDAAKICGKSPYATAKDCYLEKIDGKTAYVNEAMKRGSLLEEEARNVIQRDKGIQLTPKCFDSIIYPFMSCSLDAVNNDNTVGYEIKCPYYKNIEETKKNGVPDIYIYQCHKQMLVLGWKSVNLLYYFDEFHYFEVVIERDEAIIKEIIEKETEFWENNILKMEPPEDVTLPLNNNIEANELAMRYVQIIQAEKELQEEKETIKERLKTLSNYQSCYFPKAKLKYLSFSKRGSIDWGKVCTSWNIDKEELEKYRKNNTDCHTLTIKKD